MKVTPLILTYNEVANIGRVLERLTWAERIVVIDSGSTDETIEILKAYPQVEIFTRSFDSFASQCNYGLSKIHSEWVLSLDADYVLTDELITEIQALALDKTTNYYKARFKYCVFGKPLQGTLLPPRTILYRRDRAVYQNDGHAHRVKVNGNPQMLSGYIYHDDRKPLSRWLWAQDRYMVLEVKKLLSTPPSKLSLGDRIRKTKILAPFAVLIYCLIVKRGILDGWAGWYYTLQRVLAEILLSIHLIQTEKDS
ncbi:glycosyltransferase family 2 protein [Leptolyngbya sp. FACHB-17]|uniref:glycosyltransferase family 2 protein n=1 Tax=unclassified Leptolyngbya TaxID=2650499 RepID=UPI001680F5E2|nr:glycosyltransferase family 2 protein [Leptolyngbya sp. FACHB-17]MBD2080242.1 glycosyltransferase family 2 protein [Leptolyngbya sp. FACHB-17]